MHAEHAWRGDLTQNGTDEFALDFPPVLGRERSSTFCNISTGFTCFASAGVPKSKVFGLWSSSSDLLIDLILSARSPALQELIHVPTRVLHLHPPQLRCGIR
jgi:hypothetical protein